MTLVPIPATAPWIRCIVVGIPARDEDKRVEACLRSIFVAADEVQVDGQPITVIVVLAADDCVDNTEVIAGLVAAQERRLHLIAGAWHSAGAARKAAIGHGLALARTVGFVTPETVWIATTDADTVVGPEWLLRQLRYAETGIHAIAGTVELLDDDDRTDTVTTAFADTYELTDEGHPHVHGANLGVRGDAYVAAGGFPRIELAEDHALWSSLKRLGFRCVSALDVPVATSARLSGRAIGGFADTIAALVR